MDCPNCGSTEHKKDGFANGGKQRYICKNPECPHTTFYTEYTYNACKPSVKEAVCKPSTATGYMPFSGVWASVPRYRYR